MMIALLLRSLQEKELIFVNGKQVPPWRHRTLMLLDEFASLGTMKELELALSRIAGFGVQIMLVIQDNKQLYGSYTQYQTILGGLSTKVVYTPNDDESARWLSAELGDQTVVKKDITESGNRFGSTLNQVSVTYHEHSRPLLTPDECKRIKKPTKDRKGMVIKAGEVIILRSGLNPVYARQLLYFEDDFFVERSKIPAPNNEFVKPRAAIVSRRPTLPAVEPAAETPVDARS
jgi:type IV secretion system protein VirD4